ncbi:unnamed protein product [Ectocarpus sp. 12 AP-2014]
MSAVVIENTTTRRFATFAIGVFVWCTALCEIPPAFAHRSESLDCAADGSSTDFRFSIVALFPTTRALITDTGCPNHVHYSIDGGVAPKQKAVSVDVNGSPWFRGGIDRATNLSDVSGPVGMMINGVAVYSSYADDRAATTYGAAAAKLHGDTTDLCGGSTTADGVYHYHNAPGCLQEQAMKAQNLTADDHSPLLGWAFDGFPIYGQLGPSGVEMLRCNTTGANETYCLDECGGYEGEISGVDHLLYRYYMTCGSGPEYFPFTINCYRGCCEETTRCHSTVQNCIEELGAVVGYTDEFLAGQSYESLYLDTPYMDSDLIEGDDVDQIVTQDEMDCSFYMGSAEPNPPPAPTPAPLGVVDDDDFNGADGRRAYGPMARFTYLLVSSVAVAVAVVTDALG